MHNRQWFCRQVWIPPLLGITILLNGCALLERFRAKPPPLPGERIAVLQFERTLQVDSDARKQPLELSASRPFPSWRQPGGVATNTPYHIAGRGALEPLFARRIVAGSRARIRLITPPLVANGLVYALGSDLRLVAVDARTGEPRWSQSLRIEDKPLRDGFGGGIAMEGNIIYAATGFGEVLALNARNGDILWRTQRPVPLRNAPTVYNGRIFVIGHDSRLLVLSTKDGGLLWEQSGQADVATILAAPSVAVNDQLVVAGFTSGELQSLRVTNGLRNWNDTLTAPGQRVTPLSEINSIVGRPVLDIDRVFAVSHSGQMISVDVRSGRRVWSQDYAAIQMPWVSGNVIYLLNLDSQLLCINRSDGKLRWVQQLQKTSAGGDDVQWAGPILVGGRLRMVSSMGDFVSASARTGRILDRQVLDAPVSLAPIAANGIVYVLADNGTLFAFR